MLREMIVNLVDNALRYTPVGGTVTLSVGSIEDRCVLRVADNGPGIPPDERPHVFERFYRVVANGGEGSGLGLAIVREVVNAADGSITLETPPTGQGLTVTVTIPSAAETRGPPAKGA
jgi:two-component system sensor histidine kinase TctE